MIIEIEHLAVAQEMLIKVMLLQDLILMQALYRSGPFQYAAHERAVEVAAVSGRVRRLRPYLDDLAQMAGADVLCVPAEPGRVERAIRGRNAVLLRGCGALCAGATAGDVDAARSLLRKGCTAWLYAREEPGCRPLGQADALIQRVAEAYPPSMVPWRLPLPQWLPT